MSNPTKQELQAENETLLRSITELQGVIRSKEQVLDDQQQRLASQEVVLQHLLEEGEILRQQGEELQRRVEDRPDPQPGDQLDDDADLDTAIQAMKRHGFRILTDVKIEDCKDASEPRRRSFRNRGRWEVALVFNRQRTF